MTKDIAKKKPKKKLPILYWHKKDGYVCIDSTDNPEPPSESFIRYEPAVPKCATCNSFVISAENELAFCYADERSREVKPDGSGYCSDHSELR